MIKTSRKRHNLTQKELAKMAGLSQGYLSKLENSRTVFHSPTITQVILLSDALKVDVYELAKWFIDKEINH
ncbi:XRE family transcriptional regulator [Romboutsia maritimum]|uniref:XRE family transcriptional regulator n=1 Tax=Romboutsia maritimum TaxID=2020948 RepID=A0A371IQS6_9FIRM|nr:helix-turn-helix transcriptional regulator [Romboutsia maritimum]RDY22845.1 XRE family transcriptional regulator [Romboutsia maritimum]